MKRKNKPDLTGRNIAAAIKREVKIKSTLERRIKCLEEDMKAIHLWIRYRNNF